MMAVEETPMKQTRSKAAAGLGSPEGPLWIGDGEWLLVEMDDQRGCVTHVDAEGALRVVCRTGRPNGLVMTPDGGVLVAESSQAAIVRLGPEWRESGVTATTVADRDNRGQRFLFPNDLAVGPDGAVYITDSGLPLAVMRSELLTSQDPASLPFDGRVYRLDPESSDVETLDAGLGHLNGISFGVDGALYVNDTISGDVYRYAFRNGSLGPRDTFANVIDRSLPPSFRGPDGMAHDIEGNLYVTVFNQGEVVVLNSHGEWLARIPTDGRQPTNVAFAPGEQAIYVTERETGTLQRHDALAPGLPLIGQITPSEGQTQ